jgi:hypothetical protein
MLLAPANRILQVSRDSDFDVSKLYVQRFGRYLQRIFGSFTAGLLSRNKNCHTAERWDDLLQKLEAFGEDFETSEASYAGDVAARASEVRDQADVNESEKEY